MRPLRNFLLLLAILLSLQAIAVAQTSDDARMAITRDVTADFGHSEFAPIRQRFSDELKSAVTESDLKTPATNWAIRPAHFNRKFHKP